MCTALQLQLQKPLELAQLFYHDEALEEVHSGRACWAEMHLQRILWKELQALEMERHDALLYDNAHCVLRILRVKMLYANEASERFTSKSTTSSTRSARHTVLAREGKLRYEDVT